MGGVFFVCCLLALNVLSQTVYLPVSNVAITWLYVADSSPASAAYILDFDIVIPGGAPNPYMCGICNGPPGSIVDLVQWTFTSVPLICPSAASGFPGSLDPYTLGQATNITVVCWGDNIGSETPCTYLNDPQTYPTSPMPHWFTDPFQTYIETPPLTSVPSLGTSTSVWLQWIGPSVYNNFPTLFYTLDWSLNPSFTSLAGTQDFDLTATKFTSPPNPTLQSFNVTGLTTGLPYYFRVQGRNTWYTTPYRYASATPGAPPDVPTGLTLTVYNTTSFIVDWTNGNTNGAPIDSFTLKCTDDGSPPTTSLRSSFTKGGAVSDLATGRNYSCQVNVHNLYGTSAYSASTSQLLATKPDPPIAPNANATSPTNFQFTFADGGSNGALITGYTIQYSTDASFTSPTSVGFSSSVGVQNLAVPAPVGTTSLTYYFRLYAINSRGTSDPSTTFSAVLHPAPAFQSNTIATNSTTATSGTAGPNKYILLGDTLGGQWVSLRGTDFTSYGNPTIFYKDANTTTQCLNAFVQGQDIWCQIQAGAGTLLHFSVASGTVQGQGLSGDYISYPGPQITPLTLRRNGGNNSEPLPAERDTPELLVFDGKNFGPSSAGGQVKYGPASNPTQFTCDPRSWSDTRISCETEQGSQQRNLHFTVSVKGQSFTGTDTYNYPTTPGISSVSGCPGTGCGNGMACGCPTSGNITLTLTGENFTEPLSFRIRGAACTNVVVNATTKSATCVLPEGTGINLQVSATQGNFESDANLLSYALPVLTNAYGCTMTQGSLPFDCSRTDGDVVMVTGTNLGATGATLFVGGTPCLSTVLNVPHTSYNCTVPPGAGQARVISLFQSAGEISVTQNVTLSYAVCPEGTYADGVYCTNCSVGTANNLKDQPKCVACPVGRYQNLTGQWNCTACQNGTAQGSTGQTQCIACTPGLFAAYNDNLGSPICNPCAAGTYTNDNATDACYGCPGGQYQNLTGATSCSNCSAGQQPSPGSISCLECENGYYNPVAGNVLGCPQAPPGTIASQTSDRKGATNFSECEKGTHANVQHTICVACEPGFFGNMTRIQDCTPCAPGYFADQNTSTACSQCLGGTFNNYPGASLCFGCDTGTFSGDGAQICTKCAIGFFGPDVNATGCSRCAQGLSSGLGFSNCTACGPGRYSNGSVPSALCDACEAGTFAQNQSSVKCDDCSAGRASKSGSQVCTVCGVGYYSNSTRSADCLSCAPGSFTDSQELTFCKACYAGYFAASNASKICLGCAAGFYQPNTGGVSCSKCPAGRYTTDVATIECHECPEGQVANPNALGCLDLYYQTNAVKFFFLVMALCCLGVTVGSYIGLVVWRDHRVIHHSQPLILWVMLFGFALVFISVILYIWDQTNAMCIFRNVALNLGVSIVIVPLTLKTWRLHRIFNRSKTDAIQTVVIKDWVLVVIFGVVLLYDIITFIAWSVTAPFSVWTLIGRCDSNAEPWIHAVLWWWKPVCCLYLAYLVYRVRDIDERFNEAWWIGIALYNAVVVLAVFAVLTYTLDLTPRKWYIMFVVIIIYLGLTTWALIYWVKWYQIYRKDTENERMLGNAVANDIADAEEVIQEEKQDIKDEEQEKKKGLDPDKGDEQLSKLHKSREKKARELQKLLQIVERTKTRMKTDMTNLNRYTSELLAMQQEIEYRKRMLEKKGVAVPPPASSTAAAGDGGKDKDKGTSGTGASDYSSGAAGTDAAGAAAAAAAAAGASSYGEGKDENKSSGYTAAAETSDAGGDKDPADGGYSGISSGDRSPSGDGEDTFVA